MWYNKICNLVALRGVIERERLSERALAERCGLSRLTLRALISGSKDSRLSSWSQLAAGLEGSLSLVLSSRRTQTDCSIQAVGYRILQDGESSWKIHLMDFVDEFRRSLDGRLILLPPPATLSLRLQALIRSTVCFLTEEVGLCAPEWARKQMRLEKPWFVSESEVLKPMMILESPLAFRRNGIFVGENFLKRA